MTPSWSRASTTGWRTGRIGHGICWPSPTPLIGSPAFEYSEIHWDSIWVDLDTIPAQNVTTGVNAAGGTTTTYLVPTAELPILLPPREQGVPEEMIALLNSALKPIVDIGYTRNDPTWLKNLRAWWNPSSRAQGRG